MPIEKAKPTKKVVVEKDGVMNNYFTDKMTVNENKTDVENLRKIIEDTAHKEYIDVPDTLKIIEYSRKILDIYPNDLCACFYEAACGARADDVNVLLNGDEIRKSENAAVVHDLILFAIKSLNAKSFDSVKNLIDDTTALTGKEKLKFKSLLENEAGKLKNNFYDPYGRVFIAFSSKDKDIADSVCAQLENSNNGLNCFLSHRNLRHFSKGANSGSNNYEQRIENALDVCESIIFISTENSRTHDCEAIGKELDYVRKNLPNKPRIEYIHTDEKSDYDLSRCDKKTQDVIRAVFSNKERCVNIDGLIAWAAERHNEWGTSRNQDDSKYCRNCGAKHDADAKICSKCETRTLVSSVEWDRVRLERDREAFIAERQQWIDDIEQEKKDLQSQKDELAKEIEKLRKERDRKAFIAEQRQWIDDIEQEKKELQSQKDELAKEIEKLRKERNIVSIKQQLNNNAASPFYVVETELKEYVENLNVVIPYGVTRIGDFAFYDCDKLESVTIPNSVISIGNYAFSGCGDLESIEIPNSVASIGNSAFKNCSSLSSIEIPNSVTSIGDEAFYDCRDLESIEIPNSVISIGDDAFCDCKNLEFEEYDGVLYLGNLTNRRLLLVENTDLSIISFTIDFGTKFIDSAAFYNCNNLMSIEIPNSVKRIGSEAFFRCSKLISIKFNGTKVQWNDIEKGVNWDNDTGPYTVHCTDGDIAKA